MMIPMSYQAELPHLSSNCAKEMKSFSVFSASASSSSARSNTVRARAAWNCCSSHLAATPGNDSG
jgi:hypothetical protein